MASLIRIHFSVVLGPRSQLARLLLFALAGRTVNTDIDARIQHLPVLLPAQFESQIEILLASCAALPLSTIDHDQGKIKFTS